MCVCVCECWQQWGRLEPFFKNVRLGWKDQRFATLYLIFAGAFKSENILKVENSRKEELFVPRSYLK